MEVMISDYNRSRLSCGSEFRLSSFNTNAPHLVTGS